MQFGIAVADRDLPDDSGTALARRVDAAGAVHSLWTNETGGADATVALGAWAAVTDRVLLGTGVVPLSARSTATLQLATNRLSRLSHGRLLLGVGVGQRAAAEKLHERTWQPPLQWTRDAVGRLQGNGAPVLVGALGPRMLWLAATAADGAVLNWSTAAFARHQRAQFDEASAGAGRDRDGQLLCGYVRVAAGPDAAEALAAQIAFYARLPFYREHWAAMGDPDDTAVTVASVDGSGLVEALAAFDAFDVVVARIVPTDAYGVERMVETLCAQAEERGA